MLTELKFSLEYDCLHAGTMSGQRPVFKVLKQKLDCEQSVFVPEMLCRAIKAEIMKIRGGSRGK